LRGSEREGKYEEEEEEGKSGMDGRGTQTPK
jgi:hypothetical protein